jgi:hypothetical protein
MDSCPAGATISVEIRAGWQDPGTANTGKPSNNGVLNPPADATHANAVRLTTDAHGRATFNFVAQSYIGGDYRLVFRSGTMSVTSPTISIVNFTADWDVAIEFSGSGQNVKAVQVVEGARVRSYSSGNWLSP